MTNVSHTIISFLQCTYLLLQLTDTADFLAQEIVEIDHGDRFELLSDGKGAGLPLVAWKLKREGKYDGTCVSHTQNVYSCSNPPLSPEFAIARTLRSRGWIVPAYTMAPHTETMKLLRVVVREDFSRDRCQMFLRDLKDTVCSLVIIRTKPAISDRHPCVRSSN